MKVHEVIFLQSLHRFRNFQDSETGAYAGRAGVGDTIQAVSGLAWFLGGCGDNRPS